jgi:hypothetical protein
MSRIRHRRHTAVFFRLTVQRSALEIGRRSGDRLVAHQVKGATRPKFATRRLESRSPQAKAKVRAVFRLTK